MDAAQSCPKFLLTESCSAISLDIVRRSFATCDVLSLPDEFSVIVGENFVSGAGNILLLGIFVFTLFGHLSKHNTNIGEVARAFNAGFFLLLVLIWLPYEIIDGYTAMELVNQNSTTTVETSNNLLTLSTVSKILGLTYTCAYLLSSFIVACLIIKAFKTAPAPFKYRARQWSVYTLLAFVVAPFITFIAAVCFSLFSRVIPSGVNVLFIIFGEPLVAITTFGVLKIVEHSTESVPVIDTENVDEEK
jgi:hypothetical protein